MPEDNLKIDIKIIDTKEKEIKSIEETQETFGSWLKLNLSEEKLQEITNNIIDEIDTIEADRKDVIEKIKQYRNEYDQIVEDTSLPFSNAFNLNVPLVPKNVDACVSQTEEAFEGVDPKWAIETPPDKALVPFRDIQEKTLDYYSDTEMEDVEAWGKVYHDAFLLGIGWLCMVFRRDFLKVRDFMEYNSLEQFQKDFSKDWQKYPKYISKLSNGKTIKLVIEYNQEICHSAKPEHAEVEDIYVPLNTNGVEGMLKARIVARYLPKRWEEIYTAEQNEDYIKGVADKLKLKVSEKENSEGEVDPDYLKKTYHTFEVMYFVDIDNDNIEERCLFNIEREHKLCIRAIRYPYDHNRPYVTPYYIQNTRRGIYQPGLGEKLLSLNIALNAILNHTLNASIIANSLSLKVRSGTDAIRALYEHQWYPGSILELTNVDDVQQFTFNTPNLSSLINLFAIVERFGEDVSGIVNYVMGQESENDPQAPASKTIALMRKSEIKLRRYIKCLKRSNNEVGYQALRLIYQYVPHSKIAKALGIDEVQIKQAFGSPLRAITQSSGFAIERMFEKRDNVEMLQILMKDPEIGGNATRRMIGYRILAKDYGSNWDKKIELIAPTPEEMQQKEKQMKEQADQKKTEVIKRATTEALNKGASPEEAEEVGKRAAREYDTMLSQQQPPQEAK